MSRGQICANCEHFGTKGYPEQAANGMGRCDGFDGHVAPVEPFVPWNGRTCVLFGLAKDLEPRQRWIERMRAEADNANTPTA